MRHLQENYRHAHKPNPNDAQLTKADSEASLIAKALISPWFLKLQLLAGPQTTQQNGRCFSIHIMAVWCVIGIDIL